MSGGAGEQPQLIGLLVAAGRGRRMGGAKQLALWPGPAGPSPLVAAAFDAVAGVCQAMLVVVGDEAGAVIEALGDRAFEAVQGRPDAEMFDSILAGLEAAVAMDPAAAVLIHPADHPQVAAATLEALLGAARGQPEVAVMPEYRGRGGHPVIVPPVLIGHLRSAATIPGGLRGFWSANPRFCRRLPVLDPTAIQDIDRPDQLTP